MDETESKHFISNPIRNKIERERQSAIDDEIQKLMCFMPKSKRIPQKTSRGSVLLALYSVAKEKMKEEHVKSTEEPSEQTNDN
uniref:BHLH domain-containing protein n=1 Tax=Caenorhabditis tropicalis TaxID=1561998 RepID=A0A1I7TSP2_9PELO